MGDGPILDASLLGSLEGENVGVKIRVCPLVDAIFAGLFLKSRRWRRLIFVGVSRLRWIEFVLVRSHTVGAAAAVAIKPFRPILVAHRHSSSPSENPFFFFLGDLKFVISPSDIWALVNCAQMGDHVKPKRRSKKKRDVQDAGPECRVAFRSDVANGKSRGANSDHFSVSSTPKEKKQPKWNEGGNYNKTEEHVGVDVVFISFKYAGDSSKSHLF